MDISFNSIIATELNIKPRSVEATIKLLNDGATIPFISRYRKEWTGSLDEVAIRNIQLRYIELQEIVKRKAYILDVIEQLGLLTTELKDKIENTYDNSVLEDLFLPYKPKRRTRASIARERGLEPLAKILMAQNESDIYNIARRFVKDDIATTDDAINGALDIIAEWVSESELARQTVRTTYERSAIISSQIIKGKESEAENYLNYNNFSQPLKNCSSYRYLAIRRGEEEGVLKVSISIDDDAMIERLCRIFIKRNTSSVIADLVLRAVKDGYKRLLRPSIENRQSP